MCLAVPLKLKEINGNDAIGERDGVTRSLRVDFIENPQVGDYVIVHAGFAIERVAADQAESDLAAAAELEAAIREVKADVEARRSRNE